MARKQSTTEAKTRNAELWRATHNEIKDLLSDNDGTRMAVASRYKQAGEEGLNRKVIKQVMALKKMTSAQQTDFLTQLQEACAALGICQQIELFAAKPVHGDAPAAEAVPEAERMEEPKGDLAAEKKSGAFPDDEESHFDAGAVREAGERAALAGQERDQNPFEPDSDEAKEFDGGWTIGHQKRVDAQAAATEGNQNPRRRRGNLALVGEGAVA